MSDTETPPKSRLIRKLTSRVLNRYILPAWEATSARNPQRPFSVPPVFFLGAPRCGSTLLFQTVADAFDIGYLSNAHYRYYGAPALAERLLRPLRERPVSNYQSNHGVTTGSSAPSEAGEWWYRFFPRSPAYVPINEANRVKLQHFRRSLSTIVETFQRPVVFKNLYASLRLQPIIATVPEAMFVVIHRDILRNSHSILEARMKVMNRVDQWWSVPTPDVDQLQRLPAAKQVVEQIRGIYRTIEADLKPVQSHHVLHVNYEDFCQDVHSVLATIEKFIGQTCPIARYAEVPKQFSQNSRVRIPVDLFDEVSQYIGQSIAA